MRRLPLLVVLLSTGPATAADYPHVHLKNDALKVTVYLPDAEKGFYRGSRFDHAGVCGEVEFAGHKLFGPWKGTHNPANNDDIVGPCEEFGMQEPLGWADAKGGEPFLKIGVGELERPKAAEEYLFWGTYKTVKPAAWKEQKRDGTSIGWKMTAGPVRGYAYEYDKGLAVDPKAAVLTITHRLKNTGTKPLVTTVYNHNFFNVDGDPVGPNYGIKFGFAPKAAEPKERFAEVVKLDGESLTLTKPLTEGSIWGVLSGHGDGSNKAFTLSHKPSGVRLGVTHSTAFDRLVVWGVGSCLCPEPFQTIKLAPGEETKWDITYTFAVEKK